MVTYFMYQAFGTSEVQSWNYPENYTPKQEQEEEPLQKEKSSPGSDVAEV